MKRIGLLPEIQCVNRRGAPRIRPPKETRYLRSLKQAEYPRRFRRGPLPKVPFHRVLVIAYIRDGRTRIDVTSITLLNSDFNLQDSSPT